MTVNNEDYVIIWEAPVIVPPVFKLYYDDAGNVICYSCEELEGNYVVIDSQTYVEARPDIRVIDGKLSTVPRSMVLSKLMPSDTGTKCAVGDMSIVVDDTYDGETSYWKLKIYEL